MKRPSARRSKTKDLVARLDIADTSAGKTELLLTDPRRSNEAFSRPTDVRVALEGGADETGLERLSPRIEYRDLQSYRPGDLGGCLEGFIRLRDATPERIAGFARKWGVLGLCGHGELLTHCSHAELPPAEIPPHALTSARWCPLISPGEGRWGGEPTAAWHRYARRLHGTLGLIASVRQGQRGRKEDWEEAQLALLPDVSRWTSVGDDAFEAWPGLAKADPRFRWEPSPTRTLKDEAELLCQSVNGWLKLARFGPKAGLLDGAPSVTLSADVGLMGLRHLLVIELLAAFTGKVGVWFCDQCREPYEPTRKPRAGDHHYCAICRGDGDRAAKRRWRAARYQSRRRAALGT
jgi:hypothetical protein